MWDFNLLYIFLHMLIVNTVIKISQNILEYMNMLNFMQSKTFKFPSFSFS